MERISHKINRTLKGTIWNHLSRIIVRDIEDHVDELVWKEAGIPILDASREISMTVRGEIRTQLKIN